MENDKSCKTPRWRMLKSQLNNLSAEDFLSVIDSLQEVVIIDVRTENEYKFGHISDAVNIDYFAEDLLDKIENLEKGKNYFVYCRSGRRSIRVCTWMRNGGFDNQKIFNLDKGFVDLLEQFPDAIVCPKS
ncbi:MAG: rhodanese-like domain-containing protein [Saprospiraceae bacterium]